MALGLLPRTPQAPWASHNCVPSAHATSWPVHVRMWIPPGRRRRLRVPEPWQGRSLAKPAHWKKGPWFYF